MFSGHFAFLPTLEDSPAGSLEGRDQIQLAHKGWGGDILEPCLMFELFGEHSKQRMNQSCPHVSSFGQEEAGKLVRFMREAYSDPSLFSWVKRREPQRVGYSPRTG